MASGSGIFEIDDFVIECGATLPFVRLAWKTHGALNAEKSNCNPFPKFLGGFVGALEIGIGMGRPVDPSKYLTITAEQFGLPPSTMPSNAALPVGGASFRQAPVADDVTVEILREAV